MIRLEASKDYVINDESLLPFVLQRNLGSGHSGNVEEVRDATTGAVFARKTITIKSRVSRDEKERTFWNEVKIIRGFGSHHHMIRIHATYIAKRTMGIILEPVADQGDLAKFLELAEEHRKGGTLDGHHLQIIDRAFGCLASGLAFMHQKRIRHKDIKPQNILVHQGNVIYTDFGYSLDCSQFNRSTTDGAPDSLTRRYAAPEVLKNHERNSSSDVFSLGCVYLELLAVRLNDPALSPDSKTYSDHIQSIHLHFESIQTDPWAAFFIARIKSSIDNNKSHRPKAAHLAAEFLKWDQFSCNLCRMDKEASPLAKFMAEEKGQREGERFMNPAVPDPVVDEWDSWNICWSYTEHRYYRAKYFDGKGWLTEWLPEGATHFEADPMDVDTELNLTAPLNQHDPPTPTPSQLLYKRIFGQPPQYTPSLSITMQINYLDSQGCSPHQYTLSIL